MIRTTSALLIALAALTACTQLPGANTQSAGTVIGTPAPGSKFARLRIGMSKTEVQDLIGSPTETGGHVTGMAYIPFYTGAGRSQLESHYKGEGILTFGTTNAIGSYDLVSIKVDRNERGYIH